MKLQRTEAEPNHPNVDPSTKRRRTKAIRSWKSYAAAAGASMAGVTAADAAIVHVVPQPALRIQLVNNQATSTYQSAPLDLDGDGNNDIVFSVGGILTSTDYEGQVIQLGLQGAVASAPEEVDVKVFTGGTTSGLARNFAPGELITSGLAGTSYGSLRVRIAISDYMSEFGNWTANGTGIAGIKFPAADGNHLSWVRVSLESNEGGLSALEVTEWAYESVAGASIAAGVVPEPSSLGMAGLAMGAAGVLANRKRRLQKQNSKADA